ncbi:GM25380 [Drosophila sechellia]|uniref:GM25380 n=1 Tax=Drosophila sechellia TaxID=7238 RepID=B4HG76_DROSE|nr:GM25380 [Drosophila sechellia]
MELFCIYLILATAIVVQGYRKFGLNCEDIACISGKKCIVSRVPCENPDQQEGEQCGTYPECQSDQLTSEFTIRHYTVPLPSHQTASSYPSIFFYILFGINREGGLFTS